MKKVISILLILILMLSTISTIANEDATTVGDISMSKVSNWAKEYVLGAEKMDICTFDDYTLPTTRLEFCEMIYNMIKISPAPFSMGAEEENKFNDTNSIAVNYLNEIGVINGTSENKFSPNDKIYREEVATIVYRLAKKLYLKGFYDEYRLSSYMYVDQDKISDWAIESVSQLKTVNLMDGVGNNMFAPKAIFTREQAVVLTMKLFSKILDDNIQTQPAQTELRIRVQEDIYTDEVKKAIKSKYTTDDTIIDIMPENTYLEKTNLIIASGDPCIIIGIYDKEFLTQLDEWGIKNDEFTNGITYIHNNINIEDNEGTETSEFNELQKDLQSFFEKESIFLTCEMDELAKSEEYISAMATGGDIKAEIEKISEGNYTNPKEIQVITFDDETVLRLMENNSFDKTMTNSLYEKIKNKFNGTIMGNMINARYGANIVAATSILTYGKGYIMPEGFKENTTIILKYDGDYSSIVSFSKTGDGVIGANAIFVKNTEQNMAELIKEIIGE